MEQPASRRIGLLLVHGIGEPTRGETLNTVVDGLELAYGKGSFAEEENVRTRKGRVARPDGSVQDSEVCVYEVFWAPELSGTKVAGSFNIRHLQQLVWFPILNWKRVENFGHEYRFLHVLAWTVILVPLGAIVTAAYQGSQCILAALQWVVTNFRESKVLRRLAVRFRSVPVVGAVLNTAHTPEGTSSRRTPLDGFLDNHISDIFNYVDSAGDASPFVPAAARRIYGIFHDTLREAVEIGKCSEIQILAHSLGSVITYHALTTYRKETEALVCLGRNVDRRAALTRVYTIGSPLEKFRFFWPKLIAGREVHPSQVAFEWQNFTSPGDLVAGPLRTYDWVPKIRNQSIGGAWGVFTAHTGYRNQAEFLNVFGPAVTAEPVVLPVPRAQRLSKVLSGLYESAGIPVLLVLLAFVGLAYVYLSWAVTGFVAGKAIAGPINGLDSLLGAQWQVQLLISDWSSTVGGFVGLFLFIPAATFWAYRNGDRVHKSYWSSGFTLEKRRPMSIDTTVKSPYRDPSFHGIMVLQVAILAVIGWIGLRVEPGGGLSRSQSWMLILALMAAFAVVAGRGMTGYWRGILIDNRNKMSLGRLQLLAWTLVILSAIVTAGLTNGVFGAQSPLSIQIPQELWVLLGISTASAVAGPAIMAGKTTRKPDPLELNKTVGDLQKGGDTINVQRDYSSMLLRNESFNDARWGDLLKGDESGNAATVDLGKLQMFFFTFVLALGYAVAIARLFDAAGAITTLPVIDGTMNTLLGISHTGYLSNKAVPHSREAQADKPTLPTGGPVAAIDVKVEGAKA